MLPHSSSGDRDRDLQQTMTIRGNAMISAKLPDAFVGDTCEVYALSFSHTKNPRGDGA